jgi:hypothetical protein
MVDERAGHLAGDPGARRGRSVTAGPVEVTGNGFAGLLDAVELSRAGAEVTFTEPSLRAGGTFVTESFLTPFRFNLGPGLVRRPPVPSLRVLAPDPLVAVGEASLGRLPIDLRAGSTVAETLAASDVDDPARRSLLLGLAVLLGIDPEAAGSGSTLAAACQALDDLVVVEGGNGVAVAALVDELLASGGHVTEGFGGLSQRLPSSPGLGTCRLFVGLRRLAPVRPAFATAVGFGDEQSLLARLGALREGRLGDPVGFVLDNSHLDPQRAGDILSSFVWQGVLPLGAGVVRELYAEAVLATLGIDHADVLFRLLWLPEETGELLGG